MVDALAALVTRYELGYAAIMAVLAYDYGATFNYCTCILVGDAGAAMAASIVSVVLLEARAAAW